MEVAFAGQLTKETIDFPLGCLQGGDRSPLPVRPWKVLEQRIGELWGEHDAGAGSGCDGRPCGINAGTSRGDGETCRRAATLAEEGSGCDGRAALHENYRGASLRAGWGGVIGVLSVCSAPCSLISHKVFLKSFCRSHPPHKSVNSSFTITNMKNKLTDLWGS